MKPPRSRARVGSLQGVEGEFALINLSGEGTIIFQFFPRPISLSARANWSPVDVTRGAKPLFYFNREPHRLSVNELWLDSTDTNQSLTPEIRELLRLLEETERGTPPLLLAAWGDRHLRCVLEEVDIDEEFFALTGEPLRARVRLSLLEVQGNRESTSSQVIDEP